LNSGDSHTENRALAPQIFDEQALARRKKMWQARVTNTHLLANSREESRSIFILRSTDKLNGWHSETGAFFISTLPATKNKNAPIFGALFISSQVKQLHHYGNIGP
jgi:hypothetical protein